MRNDQKAALEAFQEKGQQEVAAKIPGCALYVGKSTLCLDFSSGRLSGMLTQIYANRRPRSWLIYTSLDSKRGGPVRDIWRKKLPGPRFLPDA